VLQPIPVIVGAVPRERTHSPAVDRGTGIGESLVDLLVTFLHGDLHPVEVQAGYKVHTLSAYLNQPAPPAAPAVDFPKVDADLAKTNSFDYLAFALQFASPEANEAEKMD
jgi:hypothetical protein